MTIKEVCEKYGISADTLRYYERVGVIPKVTRTSSGIRNYTQDDLKWVENAICMRSAGVPVEMIVEYVRLFQTGDETFKQRCDLLKEARKEVEIAKKKYDDELERLNYKIAKYEEACKTGILVWDKKEEME
ncbi:MAG: MerR family transcriptional regulator [Erysipelotrichaceae bacterium]|uniref:MerR family transcriptional regulator n=1 Tax=Floccifex sp. TaxID=2815810 RepID=UPI002A75E007|nr:MerR family transcriptional regulator [Floccifex sp.]MDD7281929.1 MerR family transcriptional regulator [Erysipelotrichaceae bacterium]MDY2958139.1 MerR family transcriptional regulator [Floccifex sp.]